MNLVCLEWGELPLAFTGPAAGRTRLCRRLLGIWRPQLRACGAKLERLELDDALRLWLSVPRNGNPRLLGSRLQGRARRVLTRDRGVDLEWPGGPRLHLSGKPLPEGLETSEPP